MYKHFFEQEEERTEEMHFYSTIQYVQGSQQKTNRHVTIMLHIIPLLAPGQQITSKVDSFQNANFLISQPNPMMLPLIGIVSEKVMMKTVLFTVS